MLISSTVLVFAKVPEGSSLSIKEEILLDDFEGFQVNDLVGDISVSSDPDELSFSNNNLSIYQAYVGYGLAAFLFYAHL